MKESCWLWHSWGKWVQDSRNVINVYPFNGKETIHTQQYQKRQCKTCGVVEEKIFNYN